MMVVDIGYEALTCLSILVTGRALVHLDLQLDRYERLAVLAWSVAYGVAATIVMFGATSLMVTNGPWILLLPPTLTISVAALRHGLPAALGSVLRDLPYQVAVTLLATVAARSLRLGGYTGDTFHLIASARAMAQNRRAESALVSPSSFEVFPPGYSILQIPSTWGAHTANHGLGVLLALAILAILGQSLRAARRPPSTLATAAVLGLLVSSHFFWVMATYINSHAVVALLLLVAYLRLDSSKGRLLDDLPLLLTIASLVVLRVENLLLITLLLTTRAALGCETGPDRLRSVRAALAVAGATGLMHQGTVLAFYRAAGQATSASSLGLAAVALTLVLAAVLAPRLSRVRLLPFRWAIPALLIANVAYAALDLQGFIVSALATTQNLFGWRGGWGILPPLLLGLILLAALLSRRSDTEQDSDLLKFLLAACLLLFFTGFLRDLPFRVGAGDSLNRQLFHLIPLALLAIGRAVGASGHERGRVRQPLAGSSAPEPSDT